MTFSIARLIPIIKLTLVYYEKRERKKQVILNSIILNEIKIENKKNKQKKKKNSNWAFFVLNWEKKILFGIGNGAKFRPQNRVIESHVLIFFISELAVSFQFYEQKIGAQSSISWNNTI